jgi:glycosyltransferase involved in cell wall biosynthesis
MRFSVITPSFQNSSWLKLCVESVADQGVAVEHIVHDGGSTDGTLQWLLSDSRVRAFVERDRGMYDAVNRGFARAQGDFLCYLNCDEQYLPGALRAVGEYFDTHADVGLVFADFIVVNPCGEYLFHRKVQTPLKNHLRISHLPAFSCAMFFRRDVIHKEKVLFNPELRAVGDGDWVLRLLERGIAMGVLRRFTSVFTLHDENLGNSPTALSEARAMHARAPAWVRTMKPLWILQHRLRRLAGGIYRQEPFSFSLYTRSRPGRIQRRVDKPNWRWRTSLLA